MRRQKAGLALVAASIIIYAAAAAAIFMCKDHLVITAGIKAYRAINRTVLISGGILCAVIAAIYIARSVSKIRSEKISNKAEAAAKAQREADLCREKKERESLSVSRDMDSGRLRQIMDSYSAGQWSALSAQLRQLCIQLDMMDGQQEKLSHLIENNGADSLSNTKDMLDKVEQYMCKSVRKVINYMDVANASDAADVSRVREKINECLTDLQQQIRQVQEFLFALADFLNTQGDGDNSMQMLDIYKETILDSIRE